RSCARRDLHSFPTRRSSDLPSCSACGGRCRPAGGCALSGGRHVVTAGGMAMNWRMQMQPRILPRAVALVLLLASGGCVTETTGGDRKSTRLNSSHVKISYAV